MALAVTEGDARLAEVVGGHLDVDAVADADADEVFAHLAGDVGENFVAVGEGHAEHGAGEDLGHGSCNFYGFFFSQGIPAKTNDYGRGQCGFCVQKSSSFASVPCSFMACHGQGYSSRIDGLF